jgi:DNA topoisomerase I
MSFKEVLTEIGADPVKAAKAGGLRYVTDESPGFSRQRNGKGFHYLNSRGKELRDPRELRRIKSLVIPPAWRDVWICPIANGHLQATGRDARGRKQHRYHPRWREVRDETKYNRVLEFAKRLPKIRHRVARDLKLPGLPREKVLATIVRLLEISLIRVGNGEYARDNNSYGLTTMKDHHAKIRGGKVIFDFRGKGGKSHTIEIHEPRLAKIVKRCQDLPGQELFQYNDEEGRLQDVRSEDVNAYLHEIAGTDFTAKDFRTWSGTVLAARALRELQKFETKAQAKKNLVRAIENVAQRLGNTVAVCRKCYIHPALLDSYLDGSMLSGSALSGRSHASTERPIVKSGEVLKAEEASLLALLKRRTALEANGKLLRRQLADSLEARKRPNIRSRASANPKSRI